MVEATQEAALAQLSKELMQFVVDELALRVAADEKFQLSEQVKKLLAEQVNASIHAALLDAPEPDPDAIARRVVALLPRIDKDAGERSPGALGDIERGVDAAPTDRARAMRRQQQTHVDSKPSKDRDGHSGWLSPARHVLILRIGSAALLVGLLVLGFLYFQQGSALRTATANQQKAGQDQAGARTKECVDKKQITDQLHLLQESQAYKNNCKEGMSGRDENALCTRLDKLGKLTATPQQCLHNP